MPDVTPGQAARNAWERYWASAVQRGRGTPGYDEQADTAAGWDIVAQAASAAAPSAPVTILPPPRTIVTAAYLTAGVSGPGIILEVCPACTAQLPLTDRMCFCRVQCTWAGCPWDDPANLNAIARKADAARKAAQ